MEKKSSEKKRLSKEKRPEALNPEQSQASVSGKRRIAVIAGPGTGKTKTLIARLSFLLENKKVPPEEDHSRDVYKRGSGRNPGEDEITGI